MEGTNVQIAWAIVGGRRRHISEFAKLAAEVRPEAHCELCNKRFVIRLGPIRAHHYAHRPDEQGFICALTAPETALHYNTKCYLASKLEGQQKLFVRRHCTGAKCQEQLDKTLARDWDEVHVERLLDPIRPDLTLRKNGVPVFAIEVRATHIVSDGKAAILANLGIPWIEVKAGFEEKGWECADPLPFLRCGPPVADWMCLDHSKKADEEKGRREQDAERAQRLALRERLSAGVADAHATGEAWKVRVVDFYPAEGPRVRRAFTMYRSRLSGGAYRLWIKQDGEQRVIAEVLSATDLDAAAHDLHEQLAKYLKAFQDVTDSPIGWVDASSLLRPTAIYHKDRFPVRYARLNGDGPWRRLVTD